MHLHFCRSGQIILKENTSLKKKKKKGRIKKQASTLSMASCVCMGIYGLYDAAVSYPCFYLTYTFH